MDSKTLNQSLSASLGVDQKTVSAMLEAFSKVLALSAETLTTVAIPSFGSFVPMKYEEEIRTDLATGKKMMFPPQVTIEFNPAASLRKKVLESHG